MRGGAAGAGQGGQFGHVPRPVLRLVAAESLHGEPGDHDALEQHEVERDPGNLPRGEPDRDEPPTPTQGAQRQLGVRPSHRVDDHMRPLAGDLLHPGLEVLGRVVDRHLGSPGHTERRLLGRGCGGHHPGPQPGPELHRGQTHAASGAEHHGPLPRLDPGHTAQGVVRRSMGHPRGRRRGELDGGVDGLERGRRHGDLLGEGTEHRRSHHPVTDRDAVDAGPQHPDGAGELTAYRERHGEVDLVLIGHQQDVGKVHGGGRYLHHHLPLRRHRIGHVHHDDAGRRPVFETAGGTHRRTSGVADDVLEVAGQLLAGLLALGRKVGRRP